MFLRKWRKWLLTFWQKIYLYPAPEPLPATRLFWIATGLVTGAVLLFSVYFLVYLTRGQNAYLTNAEDMGIMDQAVWSTLHGQILHQTVCNILSDTNCYGPQGLMRFAIHVEPILFPLSLLYLFWPDPKTLLVVQTLVVAVGAYPAFWLARLRLRSELAAVGIALLYLLYPAQQAALVDDFHAVTFTAALLLFVFYFLYTRRTWGVFICAILAMACKEEIPLLVAGIGLWSIVFQHRWRSGLALTILAGAWAVVALIVIPHLYSPTGQALLASRYSDLGDSPAQAVKTLLLHPIAALKQNVFEPERIFYLRALVIPAGLLPLFSPWIFVLALPTLAINLLSSNEQMHSGLAFYHYDAEIVPILIFATIESLVWLMAVGQWLYVRATKSSTATSREYQWGEDEALLPREIVVARAFEGAGKQQLQGAAAVHTLDDSRGGQIAMRRLPGRPSMTSALSVLSIPLPIVKAGLLVLLMAYLLTLVIHYDTLQGPMPISKEFQWPVVTSHEVLAQQFIKAIPSTASVSAQSALVPHISHRSQIYLFPYGDGVTTPAYASYIFLDTTSDPYPYFDTNTYKGEVQKVLESGQYGIVDQKDGYVLLKRGLSTP